MNTDFLLIPGKDSFWTFRGRTALVLFTTLYVILVYVFFQPFQFYHYDLRQKSWFLLHYGVITTGVFASLLLVVPSLFSSVYLVSIKSPFFRYSYYFFGFLLCSLLSFSLKIHRGLFDFQWSLLGTTTLAAISISFFPILFFITLDLVQRRGTNQPAATVVIGTDDRAIQASLQDLIYITSDRNYLNVVSEKKGEIVEQKVRGTLKSVEGSHADLCRCHRAYIVNLRAVSEVRSSGNSFTLILHHTSKTIPISRRKAKEIRRHITAHPYN